MKQLKKIFRVLLSVILLAAMIPVAPESVKAATEAKAAAEAKTAADTVTAAGKNIVAYFPNWGIYNSAHRLMTVGMIPWDKVTVINHAFFEVDSSFKLASTDTYADFDKMMEHSEGWDTNQLRGHFGEYKYYKNLYPNVKVIVSVGGWTRGQNFHAMAATSSTRAVFIQSVVDFLKKYPFIDGIDLDWEYPGINRAADPNDQYDRGCPGGPEDTKNFTYLLQEIRQAYNSNGLSDKLLTIAVPSGYDKLALQEPEVYAKELDWLNVMTYDMHGAWELTTNHHSPLYANPADPSDTAPVDIKNRYNTDSAMKTLEEVYHIPAEKLNVGTPFYSRGWKGVTGGVNGMYGTATGAATGTWDNPQSPGGQYPYFTLKTMENQNGYVKYRDDTYAKTPWLYNAAQGIVLSYEDTASLSTRCDYINSNGYGGLIIWEISGDTSDYELTTLAYQKLIGSSPVVVASPVFSPAGGTYTSAQTVTITCATSGAQIRYTTDGSEPTSSSSLYSSALTVSATTTLKAKAFKDGNSSATAAAVYTISNSTQTVASPVFSPAGGTYTSAQTVTITCATSGAQIRYTTDGSEPTSSSSLYSSALTVSATTTLKAKAFKSGMNDSSTVTQTYTISNSSDPVSEWAPNTAYKAGDLVTYGGQVYQCVQPHTSLTGWEPPYVPALWSLYNGTVTQTVASPSFNPAGGTYTGAQTVTITCATVGAEIRYTTNGSEPTSSSSLYSSALTVSTTTTLKVKAFKSGMNTSATVTQTYTINTSPNPVSEWAPWTAYQAGDLVTYGGQVYQCVQPHTALTGWEPPYVPALWSLYSGTVVQTVATPVFSPASGTYTASQSVTITCSTAGSTIRYTLDGSEPTASSAAYSGVLTVAATTTVKAKAFLSGWNDSQTATAVYTINKSDTAASPVFSPAAGTYYGTVSVTLSCATGNATIRYTTDGTNPTSASKVYTGAIAVAATTTIKAYATVSGLKDSAVATAVYTIQQNNTTLPAHLLTGYWHNFDNGAKCLKISDVPQTYNIIAVAFAIATSNPGEVTFQLDSGLASKLGGYTEQQFISDIAAAKAKGQKVIISVGGETGWVSVNNETSAANFANSVYALMVKYGFDGVDIDLENGINATYMTSALRQLSAKAGPGLIITMAPQTIDMQSTSSGYFQVALNIKDILTIVNMQYYNSGSMLGQDGKVYYQGSVDFITALAAIQLENGLRPDQVGLGLPASSRAAGGGYVSPSVVNSAMDCLTRGTGGGSYVPPRTYPALRGVMTWSINWDASNNYEFSNSVSAKLKTLP